MLAEKKQKGKKREEKAMRKRIFAAFVCLCMLMALVPSMAYANDTVYTGGLCEHHTQHDDACGYSEGTAEIPCSHEHNESCGGLTDPAACNHTHDEACGYVPATEGTPCTFVCEVCNPQDNGNPEALSDAQPEESTCETLCTGEEINADCPVCSAEGAELDKVCVGAALMLPVTALAAAPQTLYVGDYQITNGSAITYLKAGSTAGSLVVGSEDDWTVKYEPSTATLTLNGATIQGGTSTGSVPYGAGIYAQCSNGQSVTLTIKLIGKNTITGYYGIYVNAEISENSNGTDASLTITGENNGSLEVSGSFYGIFVKSGTGNASLTINDASVVAKTTQTNSGYAGVCVQSSARATKSPQLSLAVNGGSLTTSASEGNDGIQFYVGAYVATSATTSLTVTDNAIVDARTGGISAIGVSVNPNVDIGSTGGIVFNGNTGTVYGKVELQDDLTINEGETLTVGKDASLNTGSHEVIVNGGTLNGVDKIMGTVKYAPTITTQPQDVEVKENETATFTVNAAGTEPLFYQWQQSTDNGNSWTDIAGETNATYTTGETTMDMSGTQYRCVVENSVKEVTSNTATLTVTAIPTYEITVQTDGHGTASASSTTARAGEQITLTATPNSGYRFAGWTSSDNITFANAGSAQTTFTMPAKDTTITANWKKKSSGGSVFFWDLKFDTNGGSKIDTVTEWEYSTIDLDEYVPEKEGYKFVGWYADEDLTKKIDEVYLLENITVYAKWEKIEEEVPEEPDETEEIKETETISFKDVKENDWFYEAVSYAVENGLMNGMSEDIFAPNTPLTREMLAVVLYNVEGQPESTGVNPFTDVKADIWYTDAILWANENGIVAGYDNGAYGVGDLITREQFATILYRYAQFKGYDTTQGGMAVREFSDYENISDYARPAMAWAVNAGIMGGMDDGTLMPQGKATRAEAATMLMNFCENMVEK